MTSATLRLLLKVTYSVHVRFPGLLQQTGQLTNSRTVLSPEARNWKSRHKALGRLLPCPCQLLVAPGVPRLAAAALQSLPLSCHGLFPECTCAAPPLLKRTPVVGFRGPPPIQSDLILINYTCKRQISK